MKILVIILLLSLLGCQSSEPESVAKTHDLSSTTESTENDLFSVHISVPELVETSEAFTIEVELTNEAERTIEIMSGEPVFYLIIRDSTGNLINTIARTDIGVIRPMSVNEVISEKYPYQFKKPGLYDVSAVAEFSLQDGEDSKVYKLETVQKQIEVVE